MATPTLIVIGSAPKLKLPFRLPLLLRAFFLLLLCTPALSGAQTTSGSAALPVIMDFGTAVIGTITMQTASTAGPGSIILYGWDARDFSARTVPASDGSYNLLVTFTPSQLGLRGANLLVSDNAGQHTIALTGTGALAGASIVMTPVSLSFANQAVGSTSAPLVITITNTGVSDLVINAVLLAGVNPGEFSTSMTAPITVGARGGTATLTVVFSPLAAGTRSALLQISDNAPGSPHLLPLTGTGVSAGGTPAVSLPASVSFGAQTVGTTSSAWPVMVSNAGSATLQVSSVAVGGLNPGDFAVSPAAPLSVAAGGAATLNVIFKPGSSGARSATLQIADNAGGSPHSVVLTGTGVAPSGTSFPSLIDFGARVVGMMTAQKVATSGTASVLLYGVAASDFMARSSTGADGNAYLWVTFSPSALGVRTATLLVNDTSGSHTVALTGSGAPPGPIFAIAPSIVTFGTQAAGIASAPAVVTISNNGSADLAISGLSFSGVKAGDFAISTAAPPTIAAGGSANIAVIFKPSAAGGSNATLQVSDNASGSPHSVLLSGSGVTLTSVSIMPGNAALDLGATRTFNAAVSNNANTDVTWTATAGSISGSGSSATYTAPGVAGSYTVTATSVGDPKASAVANVYVGTAAMLQVSASPATIDFGPVVVGGSEVEPLTVSNTGNAALTVWSATATGMGFSIGGFGFPVTLAAGDSVTGSIVFAPSATGAATGSVSFVSDAYNTPMAIALSGSGTAPRPHTVTLTWQSSAASIAGYNVYRSATSGGPYSYVSSAAFSNSFVDSSVQSGQTYHYVVTALDSKGLESGYSSQVSAVIPSP